MNEEILTFLYSRCLAEREVEFAFSHGDKRERERERTLAIPLIELRRVHPRTSGRGIREEYRKSEVVVGIETSSERAASRGRSRRSLQGTPTHEGTQRWRPSPEDFDPHHIARFCFSASTTFRVPSLSRLLS